MSGLSIYIVKGAGKETLQLQRQSASKNPVQSISMPASEIKQTLANFDHPMA